MSGQSDLQPIPQPPPYPVIGNLLDVKSDAPLLNLMKLAETYGPIYRLRISGPSLDVAIDMTRLTLDTIGLCAFGYRFNSFYSEQPHPFVAAMVSSLSFATSNLSRLPIQRKLMIRARRRGGVHGRLRAKNGGGDAKAWLAALKASHRYLVDIWPKN